MRPRILFVVTLAETGGAQTYVASLLAPLADRFDVAVAHAQVTHVEDRFAAVRHSRRATRPSP